MLCEVSTDFICFCICATVLVGCVFSTNEMFYGDDFKKMDTDNPLSGSWFCIAIGGLLLAILAVTFDMDDPFSSRAKRMLCGFSTDFLGFCGCANVLVGCLEGGITWLDYKSLRHCEP